MVNNRFININWYNKTYQFPTQYQFADFYKY